ncbi:MAG: hypothetical protein KKF67_02850 [Nanoarchaeota archaeon]|nr:hypothetical protein [Nanoarchaeota archaeon]
MPSKNKLKTPEWVLEGYDSLKEYEKSKGIKTSTQGCTPRRRENLYEAPKDFNKKSLQGAKKGKTFKIRECPKCSSDDVGVLLGNDEGKRTGEWECHKCKWKGKDILEKELSDEEFIKYMEEKGE